MAKGGTLQPVLGLARDDAHVYSGFYPPKPPVIYPSVTTALGVVAKPALLNWYGKIAATWAVDNIETMLRLSVDLGREATIQAVAARGRGERDRKGGIGTRTHQAVEALLAGMPVITDPETAPLLDQYQRFVADWSFKPIWSEAMICSERYGYAGTFDLYGLLEGRRALIDIKTGSFIAPEFALQLAAYGAADFIGKPGTTDRWSVPPVDLYAVLQLLEGEYRLIPYDVTERTVEAFLDALDLYRWQSQSRKAIGQPLTRGMLAVA